MFSKSCVSSDDKEMSVIDLVTESSEFHSFGKYLLGVCHVPGTHKEH